MTLDDNTDHRWVNTVLTRAVGTEPELGFRAEDVLAGARRDRAQRRARLAGTLTIVALVAIGVLVDRGRPTVSTTHGTSPVATTTTPVPTPDTTVHIGQVAYLLDGHGRAMGAELQAAHLIPADVTVKDSATPGGTTIGFYKQLVGQFAGSYYSQATLTSPAGAGNLVVQVVRQPTNLTCDGITDPEVCHVQTLPGGDHLTVERYTQAPVGGGRIIQWIVELTRPDGSSVAATSGNWSMDLGSPDAGITHASGAEPPLTSAALVRLVELPGLTP